MKKQNKTKFAILGLLTIESLSGYAIRKMIHESIAYFWSESNGQLYPTLKQLLNEQLIVLLDEVPMNKKARNRYAITEKGRILLQQWMRERNEKYIHRDENLLKLFFGNNISKQECIQLLQNRATQLNESLKRYQSIKKWLQTKVSSPNQLYWILTANNGISKARAEIEWCNESIKTLYEVLSFENSNKINKI